MTQPVLAVHGLSVCYATGARSVTAVRDVSFDLGSGETVAVIGESGSGKTTLALALVGLLPRAARISAGQVRFRHGQTEVDVRALSSADLRRFRWSQCALVLQSALNAFNPVLTIGEHFRDTAAAHTRWSRLRIEGRAAELLSLVGLDAARVLNAYPHELSGGMRQRVLLALALLLEPPIVILDEPTTALDVLTQRGIIDLLRSLKQNLGFALILISHDLSVAAELADRVLTMYAGRVVESAQVDDLFYRPRHPYSLGLLRAVPRVRGPSLVASIPGSPVDLSRLPPGCAFHPRCALASDVCLEAEPPLISVNGSGHASACVRWSEVTG